MARRLISSGSTFEAQIGYSRAVVAGDFVFVSGTTGFDYAAMTISSDVVAQAEQCLPAMMCNCWWMWTSPSWAPTPPGSTSRMNRFAPSTRMFPTTLTAKAVCAS